MTHAEVTNTRRPIRSLSIHLANQIAAGEVVERPASVIKELIENSLDAGASQISIVLENGGTQSISVSDDGCGIPGDELLLALAPHATSKISCAEDLSKIESMGFRGEALASIASVSRLQLTSRSISADSAWTLSGRHGEKAVEPTPASHPVGTTIRVQELFFNTPARRRFLRSERTEFRHCEEVIRRIALCRFDIAFSLKHNQRTVFKLAPASDENGQLQRLEKLCGRDFLQHAQRLHCSASGMRLDGWISDASGARPQADIQFFFLNGRIIRDRVISHALRQAYANSLYPGRHPAYVLHLALAPEQIDVNVHPTKYEVRFEQSRLVHDFLGHSVRQVLSQQALVDVMPYAKQPLTYHQGYPADSGIADERSIRESRPVAVKSVSRGKDKTQRHAQIPTNADVQQTTSLGRILGVLHHEYLLFEHNDGLGLVNLPQLQLELIQQQWRLEENHPPVTLPLLMPASVSVSEASADWLEQQPDLLAACGLDLERTGLTSVMVRQIPTAVSKTDFMQYLADFLAEVSSGEHSDSASILSCLGHYAARFPRGGWGEMELGAMLEQLSDLSSQQPLSHPGVTLLTLSAVAKLFSRP